jgi:hypothetical protein
MLKAISLLALQASLIKPIIFATCFAEVNASLFDYVTMTNFVL